MKKRSFLALVFTYLLAPLLRRAEGLPVPLIIIWMDEDTEIYCGPSLQAINGCFDRGMAEADFSDELLTEANRGETWDYVDDCLLIRDEEGAVQTARQSAEELRGYPWFQKNQVAQLATCYN